MSSLLEEAMLRRLFPVGRAYLAMMLFCLLGAPVTALAQQVLPSWADGQTKTAIVDFVKAVTTEGGAKFVPVVDRVAVFDNDGTLWSEHPVYFQLAFAIDRVKALAPQHPEWKENEPYKSLLAGDMKGLAASGEKGLMELMMETHANMSTDEFNKLVTEWFATAEHPRFKKHYYELTFLPMRELLDYLRANGFKTYIVSGGGIEFMRPMTERMYGIPPEQVVGSSIVTKYMLKNDVPSLMREAKIDFIDDGAGKPVGINSRIGRRPIFVAGNSDGDYEMLRWSTAGEGPRLGIIVHHTDGAREYAYDKDTHFGRLDKAMTEAPGRGWILVDMKNDWKTIYPFEATK
jgi:phosphoglycolate phosphatase-like HAD superfamily hydrolase